MCLDTFPYRQSDRVCSFCLVFVPFLGALDTWSAGVGQAEVSSELLRVLLVGSRGTAMS